MMAEYDDIDAAMQLEHDNGYNEGYHEGYHDGYGDGQDGCPARTKKCDIMNYVRGNSILLKLYNNESLIKECVTEAIDNDYTIDAMFTLMVLSLCDVKGKLFNEMVRMVQNGASVS